MRLLHSNMKGTIPKPETNTDIFARSNCSHFSGKNITRDSKIPAIIAETGRCISRFGASIENI